MRDRPTAADLLDTAAQVFRDTLLPALPRQARYEALMVLNAMGIAARQAAAGDAPAREALARLRALYDDTPEDGIDILHARLARDIRSGRFDPGSAKATDVYAHLWQVTCDKAAESCPKALARVGGAASRRQD